MGVYSNYNNYFKTSSSILEDSNIRLNPYEIMIELEENANSIFKNILASDFAEASINHGLISESSYISIQEGTIGNIFDKVIEFFKKIIEKISSILSKFIEKLEDWLSLDSSGSGSSGGSGGNGGSSGGSGGNGGSSGGSGGNGESSGGSGGNGGSSGGSGKDKIYNWSVEKKIKAKYYKNFKYKYANPTAYAENILNDTGNSLENNVIKAISTELHHYYENLYVPGKTESIKYTLYSLSKDIKDIYDNDFEFREKNKDSSDDNIKADLINKHGDDKGNEAFNKRYGNNYDLVNQYNKDYAVYTIKNDENEEYRDNILKNLTGINNVNYQDFDDVFTNKLFDKETEHTDIDIGFYNYIKNMLSSEVRLTSSLNKAKVSFRKDLEAILKEIENCKKFFTNEENKYKATMNIASILGKIYCENVTKMGNSLQFCYNKYIIALSKAMKKECLQCKVIKTGLETYKSTNESVIYMDALMESYEYELNEVFFNL